MGGVVAARLEWLDRPAKFLGSLPAERDALALLAPLVVGERTVELEAELLVADAVLEPLQVRLQQLKANLRDAESRLDSAKCEGEAGEISSGVRQRARFACEHRAGDAVAAAPTRTVKRSIDTISRA
jgi:hypothetical protein